MKFCGGCQTLKGLDEFNRSKHKKDGLATQCRECAKARLRAWYKKNREKKNWQNRDWYYNNRERSRDNHLRYTYGITLEEYTRIFEEQKGVCALCFKPERAKDGRTGKVRSLGVDHCHQTQRVRGLLCFRCNHLIGCLGDDAESIQRVLTYMLGKERSGDAI